MSSNLSRLIWLRLAVTAGITVLASIGTLAADAPLPDDFTGSVLAVIIAIFPLSVLYLTWARFGGKPLLQATVQLSVDVLLITLVVIHFGVQSAASALYFLVVGAAVVMVSPRLGYNIATLAWSCYSVALLALHKGLISSFGADDAGGDSPILLIAYKIATHLVGLYIVAYLTSKLVHRTELVASQLEHVERRYQRLESLYRNVFESIEAGVITTDRSGYITSVNRAAHGMFGIPEQVDPHSVAFAERFPRAVRELLGPGSMGNYELSVTIDGMERRLAVGVHPLHDRGLRIGQCLNIIDVTAQRQLEQELRLRERMAAVGELAAGLAHEVGNPLAAIAGSTQMLESSTIADEGDRRLLEIIGREARRLDRTIKDFLSYARKSETSKTSFDLGELIKECAELLRNSPEFLAAHELTLHDNDTRHPLTADRDQVTQIFWNLTQNGLRAMPGGGLLEIDVESDHRWVRLIVRDHGPGIDAEQQHSLMTPFQSRFREGAGIGLSIVYRIVEDHGGRIRIAGAAGGGTEARVEFPRAADELAADTA